MENSNTNDQMPDNKDIFDTIFSNLMDNFGKACEEEGVTVAIAIARHPKFKEPLVFYRAPHIVEAGSLMADILRDIKIQVYHDLNADPQ